MSIPREQLPNQLPFVCPCCGRSIKLYGVGGQYQNTWTKVCDCGVPWRLDCEIPDTDYED